MANLDAATPAEAQISNPVDAGDAAACMIDDTMDTSPDQSVMDFSIDEADSVSEHLPEMEIVDADSCGEVADNDQLAAEDLEDVFDRNFDRLDQDGNGYVSEEEISQAMVDNCYQGEDAQMVAALKKYQDDLEELSNDEWGDENDGITRADMDRFRELAESDERSDSENSLVNGINYRLRRGHDSIENADRDLFANSDDPLESIRPEAVRQGGIGDCYFLAALGSMAGTETGREAIRDMIQENNDGTYTVTFPGDRDNPVTVDAPTDSELALYAGGSEHGSWAAVLEKAYGAYNDADNTDLHDGIPGGSVGAAGLDILTPGGTDVDMISLTETETTHNKLTEAFADGRPVTAMINNELGSLVGLSDNLSDDLLLQGGHQYSVTAYDPETRMVTVRNPWGHGEPVGEDGQPLDGNDDGTFTMSLEQFERNFSRVGYAEEAP